MINTLLLVNLTDKMTQRRVCSECCKFGFNIFSRCGHILHRSCLLNVIGDYRRCSQCLIKLSKILVIEEFCVEIKNLGFDEFKTKRLYSAYESLRDPHDRTFNYDCEVLIELQKLDRNILKKVDHLLKLFDYACETDNLDLLNFILENDLDLEKFGSRGLYEACSHLSIKTLERLRSLGVNFRSDILYDLIPYYGVKILELAVENGADVNAVNSGDQRPIHIAAQVGSIEIIEFLVKRGADFNATDYWSCNTILHSAAEYNETTELVEYLAESGFDLMVKNKQKMTPLMIAVERRNTLVAEYLIKNMEYIDDANDNGRTALHLCAENGSPYILRALLLKGANVNAKTSTGKTPLHLVKSCYNHVGNVKAELLLNHGADVHAKDNDGKLPYYYLHNDINEELKQRFIDAGAHSTSN